MSYFFVKKGDVHHRINIDEIVYLQAEEQYTVICSTKNKFIVKGSLKKWIEKIGKSFIRVHGSFAVNINRIVSVKLSENIIVFENKSIPIGRSYKTDFIALLKHIH